MSFKEYELDEVLNFFNGKKRPKEEGNIPVYGGNGVIDYCNKFNFDGENIIIGRVGAYCGNINIYDGKVWISDNAILVKVKKFFNSKYMYYLLIKKELHNLRIGSSQPLLTQTLLKRVKVQIPSLEEQKAIAKILSDLDEKIEINNKINKNLEEMAQAIFKRWFVDFEFPDSEGKPYKSNGGEMVESELGMIPKEWGVGKLSDIVELSTKSVKPFENNTILYEHFSLPACDNGKRAVIEYGNNISSNKYLIDNDSILISKMNPTTKRIWNPLCSSDNAICSTEFMVYKPKVKKIKPFYYEVINSKNFTEFLISSATGSTGSRQRVKPRDTLEFKINIPSFDLLERSSLIFENIHLNVKLNIKENEKLEKTRDALLPKLMSGEVRASLESR